MSITVPEGTLLDVQGSTSSWIAVGFHRSRNPPNLVNAHHAVVRRNGVEDFQRSYDEPRTIPQIFSFRSGRISEESVDLIRRIRHGLFIGS